MKDILTVRFVSVDRQILPMECDSVRLPISDNIKGEFSGSYGIKRGHAKAVFSLKEGNVILTSKDKSVFSVQVSDGFATVENNVVTITVSSFNESTE